MTVLRLPAMHSCTRADAGGVRPFLYASAPMIEFDPPIAFDVLLERGDAGATVEISVEVPLRRFLDFDDAEQRRPVTILLVGDIAADTGRPDLDPELATAQVFDAPGAKRGEFAAQPPFVGERNLRLGPVGVATDRQIVAQPAKLGTQGLERLALGREGFAHRLVAGRLAAARRENKQQQYGKTSRLHRRFALKGRSGIRSPPRRSCRTERARAAEGPAPRSALSGVRRRHLGEAAQRADFVRLQHADRLAVVAQFGVLHVVRIAVEQKSLAGRAQRVTPLRAVLHPKDDGRLTVA